MLAPHSQRSRGGISGDIHTAATCRLLLPFSTFQVALTNRHNQLFKSLDTKLSKLWFELTTLERQLDSSPIIAGNQQSERVGKGPTTATRGPTITTTAARGSCYTGGARGHLVVGGSTSS